MPVMACAPASRQTLREVDGKLQAASWHDAFDAIGGKVRGLDGSKIGAIAGDYVRRRSDVCAQGPDGRPSGRPISIAARTVRSSIRRAVPATRSTRQSPGLKTPMPCLLDRLQPTSGSADYQCAAAQALVEGGFKVGMVGRSSRSDLSLRASRCGSADPSRDCRRHACFLRDPEICRTPDDHRRAGRVDPVPTVPRFLRLPARLRTRPV